MTRKALFLVVSFMVLFLVVWVLFVPSTSNREARYTITDLGEGWYLGNQDLTLDINIPGDLLLYYAAPSGIYAKQISEIRTSDGATKQFNLNIGKNRLFRPCGFNDLGQIVGEIHSSYGSVSTIILESSGELFEIGGLGGLRGKARSINNLGQIVGSSMKDGSQGFLWSTSTSKVVIANTSGVRENEFFDINDSGEIVGYQYGMSGRVPILRSATGEVHVLETLGHGPSIAMGLNNEREVVGSSGVENRFLRLLVEIADEIAEEITGKYSPNRGFRTHAFLWKEGLLMDLNDLIPLGARWELIQAHDINERGEIVGWGWFRGRTHVFLLTPSEAVSK